MPSITNARLKELNNEVESALARAQDARDERDILRRQLRAFDDVLDKITRAAAGMPLGGDNRGYALSSGMGFSPGGYEALGGCRAQIGPEERAERLSEDRERQREERIVNLESRLAAVTAVAEFAKAHKA